MYGVGVSLWCWGRVFTAVFSVLYDSFIVVVFVRCITAIDTATAIIAVAISLIGIG